MSVNDAGMRVSIKNLDKLLPEEKDELQRLYFYWQAAREAKDWNKADHLRNQVKMWDTTLIWLQDGVWHADAEHTLNRQRRAFRRMIKYDIDIYPWNRAMLKVSEISNSEITDKSEQK